jgi:hypothetical protein
LVVPQIDYPSTSARRIEARNQALQVFGECDSIEMIATGEARQL